MGTAGGDVEAGFAKLQGEDFEYYMQTYSIILGRNSKKSTVDVDLSSLGGGMNISRHHARIFYDFARRRFALEVLGKNGCLVEGVLHLPGNPPVKLDSQDLLQIGDKEFYFLLPVRSILSSVPRHYAGNHHQTVPAGVPPPGAAQGHYNYGHGHLPAGSAGAGAGAGAMVKKGRRDFYEEEYEMDDDVDVDVGGGSSGKKIGRREAYDGYGGGYGGGVGSGGKASLPGPIVAFRFGCNISRRFYAIEHCILHRGGGVCHGLKGCELVFAIAEGTMRISWNMRFPLRLSMRQIIESIVMRTNFGFTTELGNAKKRCVLVMGMGVFGTSVFRTIFLFSK
ncbi:hypothetical protein L195_g000713 [Trifolium pratense]|uniref:FHA domain-containing protein n=1 Tax=Trifolium pratense TaxID=57577 RepID=A0A2K3NMN2_TRIPR|nr:hypothetical protein L195_g000713 [Trifolium pratense]